ncbi:MAG TPA: protein translocase SEC61 complex subunit gamma [Nitrosopumilaceae archaeon]|nr:protein translocase SEC61 complex subunit gamma [Nitrosopumilaceae archaeon]
MGNPKQLLRDMANTLKLARKSDKDDYMQHLRLVLLGIATVGTIGFIIQFVFSVINFGMR